MAYDKHVWTCGEAITTEKLNHMEDGIANAGGDCDCGYECTEGLVTLTEETVTTVQREGGFADGGISYSGLINAEVIKVTFNGTEYECVATRYDDDYGYGASYDDNLGAYDWSEYPFNIFSYNDGSDLITQTAGTYSIKVEAVEYTATQVDPCFKAAVYSGGSVMARVDPTALFVYRIDLNVRTQETVPAKSKVNIMLNISPTSENTSINNLNAAWGEITHNLQNALVVPKNISARSASVDVYNFGDSAITLDTTSISAKILSFERETGEIDCVLLGSGCSGGK